MKNIWVKFGCFLIGYKYELIQHCSVASEKAVIKYTSAVILVCLIWTFVGFAFTQRYLQGGYLASISGATIMALVVIQIERQIILTFGKNNKVLWVRGILAVVMALIGSIIIDQIMFNQDIEKIKISNVVTETNRIFPEKAKLLNEEIKDKVYEIGQKQKEREENIREISINPTITTFKARTIFKADSNGVNKIESRDLEQGYVKNPKTELIPQIDQQIQILNEQKIEKENKKLHIEKELYNEIISKNGFLDELDILFTILLHRGSAFLFWIFILSFFFLIEVLVLITKISDSRNDYEQVVLHQMNIRIEQLNALDKN